MGTTWEDQNGNAIIGILVDDTLVEVGANPVLQEKTTDPTDTGHRVTPDTGYDALSAVNVNRIPETYVKPYGNVEITENTTFDVSRFQTVTVNVQPQYNPPSGGSASEQAKEYHSIIIGDKNTWDDWHLVPTSRPSFSMPQVKSNFVDIPGGDGMLDLTAALTGRPTYSNRQGSFEFIVMNDYGYWTERYSDIANYLHGKVFKATLCDDPEYYYEGRFYLNEWKSDKNWSRIVIDYNVGPYKMSLLSAGDKWLWDPFDFENGRIESYRDIAVASNVSGDYTMIYPADIYETEPVFTCAVYNNLPFEMTVTLNGSNPYPLRLGTNVLENLSFINGSDNVIVFHGTGVVSIENTGGRL